jgi:aminoglycoside 2'-N-acetyltransferase I
MHERAQIFAVAETDPALDVELRDWFRDEFGHMRYQWAEPNYYAILRCGGELAGRLAVFDRQVSVGGVIVRVGGIGGVATKSQFRHQGVASALLSRAAEFMKSQPGAEFGLLLCQPKVSPVYGKLGWTRVDGPTSFSQPGGTVTYPHYTMVLPLTDKVWPRGAIDMLGLPW